MSENSQNILSGLVREATRPEQANFRIIENFMVKLTKLLEILMETRRTEQVPATRAYEALE